MSLSSIIKLYRPATIIKMGKLGKTIDSKEKMSHLKESRRNGYSQFMFEWNKIRLYSNSVYQSETEVKSKNDLLYCRLKLKNIGFFVHSMPSYEDDIVRYFIFYIFSVVGGMCAWHAETVFFLRFHFYFVRTHCRCQTVFVSFYCTPKHILSVQYMNSKGFFLCCSNIKSWLLSWLCGVAHIRVRRED